MKRSKVCTKCGKEKELSEFHSNPEGKFGLRSQCKICVTIYSKEYNQRPETKEKQQKRISKNKEKIAIYQKHYRDKNKEKLLKQKEEYYIIHKEEIKMYKTKTRQQTTKNRRIRYNRDIKFKIRCVLSHRINDALKRNNKSFTTMLLIGCEIDYLMYHLQNQFTKGMSWDNHSLHGWHIDHKIPCAKFDLSKPEEQHKCFHFSNLQPLWAIDNLKKGNK